MRIEPGEQGCRQVGNKANEVARVAGALNWSDLLAGSRWEYTRNVDLRDARGDMLHGGVLKLENVDVLSRVPDLEDKLLAVAITQVKILIPFAGQFAGGGVNSVQLGGEAYDLLLGKLGSFSGGGSHFFSV